MTDQTSKRRRWLLGLEPIFEGGFLHKGRRARRWDVEDELVAVAVLGDVTVDLRDTRSLPDEIHIEAWGILRDVDIYVPAGTHVELSGGRLLRGDLKNDAPTVPPEQARRIVRIQGHTLTPFSDINVRGA